MAAIRAPNGTWTEVLDPARRRWVQPRTSPLCRQRAPLREVPAGAILERAVVCSEGRRALLFARGSRRPIATLTLPPGDVDDGEWEVRGIADRTVVFARPIYNVVIDNETELDDEDDEITHSDIARYHEGEWRITRVPYPPIIRLPLPTPGRLVFVARGFLYAIEAP